MVAIGTITPSCNVPAEMCLNMPFSFRSDVDDDIHCLWDFGDGTPVQSGSVASHSYSQVGNYSISFTVDPDGPCRQTQVFDVELMCGLRSTPTRQICFRVVFLSRSGL